MKPVKNTVLSLRVGGKIRHRGWSTSGGDAGYYEIGNITMQEGFQVVHLKHVAVNYIIKDSSIWEWI